jgi:hypothetical protein
MIKSDAMSVTITRLYSDEFTARRAIKAVEAASARAQPANAAAPADRWTVADAAAAVGGVVAIVIGLALLFIPGLGAIVFGLVGGWLIHRATGEDRSVDVHAEQVRPGGVLVVARVPDNDQARVEAVLDRAAA